jgi:hypothetical protein
MNNPYHVSEKGQAIVFLVIGLVVFLGFVAMAIDGGMALADRRHVQNSADAGSLAGGGNAALSLEENDITNKNWDCSSEAISDAEGIAITTATSRTLENVDIDSSLGEEIFVDAVCSNDEYIDVTVDVTATTPSNFLQLIFPEAMQNRVDSVTRIYPRQPISPGNAIIALNPQHCQGTGTGGSFFMDKKSPLYIYNGNIHSNGCLRCNGNANIYVQCDYVEDPTCDPDNLGSFSMDPPETCSGVWDPAPEYPTDLVDPTDFNIIEPECSGYQVHEISGSTFAKNLKDSTESNPYHLDEGLWCINGDVVNNSNAWLTGTNVTLYIRNGDYTGNGAVTMNLSAATDPDASPEMPGILLYVPAPDPYNPGVCTNHTVKLNGGEGSVFNGSVLAPCSQVKLLGTGDNVYAGQIIGWNVDVGGDANLNLTYKDSLAINRPTWINLYK